MTTVHDLIFTPQWNRPFGEGTSGSNLFPLVNTVIIYTFSEASSMMTHFLVLPPLQYYSVAPSCDLYTCIYYRIHKGTKSPSLDMFATI